MFCFPDTGRVRERIRVSVLREVTRLREPTGTEALLALAELNPIPDSPWFTKFWEAVGFFSMLILAYSPSSLIARDRKVQ